MTFFRLLSTYSKLLTVASSGGLMQDFFHDELISCFGVTATCSTASVQGCSLMHGAERALFHLFPNSLNWPPVTSAHPLLVGAPWPSPAVPRIRTYIESTCQLNMHQHKRCKSKEDKLQTKFWPLRSNFSRRQPNYPPLLPGKPEPSRMHLAT